MVGAVLSLGCKIDEIRGATRPIFNDITLYTLHFSTFMMRCDFAVFEITSWFSAQNTLQFTPIWRSILGYLIGIYSQNAYQNGHSWKLKDFAFWPLDQAQR